MIEGIPRRVGPIERLTISVAVDPEGRPDRAIGLLIPRPPDTSAQRLLAVDGLDGWKTEALACANSPQRAWLVRDLPAEPRFSMTFGPGAAPTPAPVFDLLDNRFTRPPRDLQAAIDALVAGEADDEVIVRRVVDHVAARFDYGPRNMQFETPMLVCDIATGNCVDINTVLLSALYAAGIPATYQAGYWFEARETGESSDGMHCWITTRTAMGGERHWDVAHCLQTGVRPVAPGLNPAGGVRAAMTWGRGLRYAVGGIEVEISHFAQPHWIGADGAATIAPVTTRLTLLEEAVAAASL